MFLNRLSKQYELVIFGDEETGIIQDICMALDPNQQMLPGRFGREATLFKNGQYIKDLSYLNRPVKDIIYIDFSDEKASYHKDNTIIIPHWDGNNTDRELYDILPFLEKLAQQHGCDARKEIARYGREDTGKKYREVMIARRDIINKKRSEGFTGAISKLTATTEKSPRMGSIPNFETSFENKKFE